ncbi:tail fiber protein [Flavobacterium bizetiae]|uniref:tail fiber protein n=1 Tax=Flavobacterium bizetiae TaxID=2704140 RepID=UPI0021E88DEF|nr:tail fiber protein [Flavobacterium bizetiae]UTN05108.1 tail fiber protein [Flavobacterium bizetiae]
MDLSSPVIAWVELATRGKNNFIGDQSISGNVGIGTSFPSVSLDVNGKARVTSLFYVNDIMGANGGDLRIGPNTANNSSTIFTTGGAIQTERMRINYNGNVGIGTTVPKNKLDVNGTIHSKEVKVDMEGWSDFVFKKEYNLPTLEEVEKHIVEKGHLENIPSEAEVLKDGINLGEMNAKLLQKIEGIALYIIEQNKQIIDLKSRLEKVEAISK